MAGTAIRRSLCDRKDAPHAGGRSAFVEAMYRRVVMAMLADRGTHARGRVAGVVRLTHETCDGAWRWSTVSN